LTPFAEIIPYPTTSTRNARNSNRKKHQACYLTSEEDIRNSSEKRRRQTCRENIAKERIEKDKTKRLRAQASFLMQKKATSDRR
jgi:hypothetical protein